MGRLASLLGQKKQMSVAQKLRHLTMAALAGLSLVTMAVSATIVAGALTPAVAQVSEEFEIALEPYGSWRPHPRFGQVWVPTGVPRDWRPYEYGHWVYTDDWGWYWVSDAAEEDWGWVTYHYGRWAFERRLGWFWVPGDEWAPAWVDWRYGDDYIGWAALPPDELIDAYEAEPALWIFVPGRYMTAPRLRTYIVPPQRRAVALRATRLVNRTMRVQGARLAVNPGISPAFVAAVTRTALPAYRVRPRVFGSTQGVSGAVQVRTEDLRAGRQAGQRGGSRVNAISVQRTTTVIRPAASAAAPQPLGKDERGRLGSYPPRAAQGGGGGPQQQQQAPAGLQQAPASPPRTEPRAGQRPGPAAPASPPPAAAPPQPAAAPAAPPATRQGEPPPQAKPVRPIAPQTPPPPPPAESAPRQPPAVAPPAPPPHPVAPAAAPPPPPGARAPAPPKAPEAKRPAVPLKPGEKPPEVPK